MTDDSLARRLHLLEGRLEEAKMTIADQRKRFAADLEARDKREKQLIDQHASMCAVIAERTRHMNGLIELALLHEREEAAAQTARDTEHIHQHNTAAATTARAIVETIKRKRTEVTGE